jgi:ArsR family transcriptional regulator
MGRDQGADGFRLHAELCRVLTDPKRHALLHALADGERSVGDLASVVGCSLPNASQHLAVLRSAGLVAARRSGTAVHYRLAEPEILAACAIVGRIVHRRIAAEADRAEAAGTRALVGAGG